MVQLIRSLLAPICSLILLISGSGLINTITSLRLELEHFSDNTIGCVVSALYLGILLGSFYLCRLIAKLGHIHSYGVFALASTLLVAAQAIWINPIYWAFLRLISGICAAGIFIVIESWFLMKSPLFMRSAVLSLYLVVFYAAYSIGQLLINIADLNSILPFGIASGLFALSIVPVALNKTPEPLIKNPSSLNLLQLFRISPLGILGGVISGMLLAVIFGLVPVYAKEIGMEVSSIGPLMAIIIFGGMIFLWPIGRWADKTDRRRVLTKTSFLTMISAIAITWIGESPWAFLCLGWFFGGFSFTIYPLSMAHTCEKITEEQIVSATGGFVLFYGVGAITGPLIASFAMTLFGTNALFYFIALIAMFLCLIGQRQSPSTNANV